MNIWQNDYIDKLYRTCLKYSLIGKNGEIYILRSPMCRDQPLGNHHCHNVVRGYKARGSDTYPPQPLGKPTSWSRFSVCLYCSGKPRIIPGSKPPHTGDGEKRKKWGNKHHSPGEVLLKRREKPKSPPTGLYCSWGWEFWSLRSGFSNCCRDTGDFC